MIGSRRNIATAVLTPITPTTNTTTFMPDPFRIEIR